MATLPAEPVPTAGDEADRLSSHLQLCALARGRWALLGNAAEDLRSLLLGHVVSSAVVLIALAVGMACGLAWLMG